MAEANIVIQNAHGFHVRPTTMFVDMARRFSSTVEISLRGIRVDAKGPMGMLSLGAMKDDEITIHCDGSDEDEALKALIELVSGSFGGIE